MAFLDDIKSKHLSTFVLVTIGDDIRISTQKITFDDEYYKPILLNIPSISESLDIEQRKYKISSVSLSISDYEEDGERFSDNLNTLMNKEVKIYYSSPSCSDFNDCHLAGTYIVRSFSQDEDKVTLNCEDLSQDKLHQDFPLNELGDDDIVPDKYKNKPIPMVFGKVDRSPCVISKNYDNENFGNAILIADSIDNNVFAVETIGDSYIQYEPLFIFVENKYYNVSKTTKIENGTFPSHEQYNILTDGQIELLSFDKNSNEINSVPNQNPSIDQIEINTLNSPKEISPSPIYNNMDRITHVLNEYH